MGILKSVVDYLTRPPEADGAAVKPGRNEACWCGSGKKYKKCHLPLDEKKQAGRFSASCKTS
ncbi:MAG: hypothetical protein Kow0025_08120 [Thermodesulfovibrionales bacterium]